MPIAHVSGLPEVPRKSLWHALNSRAVAHRFAREHGKEFDALNLLVAHMGSGITVVCLEKGKAIDSTNANSEAPFSPERAGILPSLEFAALCYDGTLPKEKMTKKLTRESGLKAHLGTNDALAVEKMIAAHDEKARIVYEAMAYGISKTLGALATAVRGKVDAILLTGSLARSSMLTGWIGERVSFIAPVHVYPGQEEMKSLALSVSEVLGGTEQEKTYR
jgi:butyrate kinase